MFRDIYDSLNEDKSGYVPTKREVADVLLSGAIASELDQREGGPSFQGVEITDFMPENIPEWDKIVDKFVIENQKSLQGLIADTKDDYDWVESVMGATSQASDRAYDVAFEIVGEHFPEAKRVEESKLSEHHRGFGIMWEEKDAEGKPVRKTQYFATKEERQEFAGKLEVPYVLIGVKESKEIKLTEGWGYVPKLVKSDEQYDYYVLDDKEAGDMYKLYNIVPKGSEAPAGGYRSKGYIEHIKHASFDDGDKKYMGTGLFGKKNMEESIGWEPSVTFELVDWTDGEYMVDRNGKGKPKKVVPMKYIKDFAKKYLDGKYQYRWDTSYWAWDKSDGDLMCKIDFMNEEEKDKFFKFFDENYVNGGELPVLGNGANTLSATRFIFGAGVKEAKEAIKVKDTPEAKNIEARRIAGKISNEQADKEYHSLLKKLRKGIPEAKEDTKDTKDIKVKNPGILAVPVGKHFYDMPESHYIELAEKDGKPEVMRALENLHRWNKEKHPKVAGKAAAIINRLLKNKEWVDMGADKGEKVKESKRTGKFSKVANESRSIARLKVKKMFEAELESWESAENYMGDDMSDYYVGPTITRDSEALERSNFKKALEMLGGGEIGEALAGKDRNVMRKIQDKFLSSSIVKDFIKRNGEDVTPLHKGDPTIAELRKFIYPELKAQLEKMLFGEDKPVEEAKLVENEGVDGYGQPFTHKSEPVGEYKTNEQGVITSPGKFEGQKGYAPYFWERSLEGADWESGGEEFELEYICAVEVVAEDVARFPELKAGDWAFIQESSDGFVTVTIKSAEDSVGLKARIEAEDADIEKRQVGEAEQLEQDNEDYDQEHAFESKNEPLDEAETYIGRWRGVIESNLPMPNQIASIWDAEGVHIKKDQGIVDRYTAVLKSEFSNDSPRNPQLRDCLGFSEGGRAVSQWGECIPGGHLGKKISWEQLSPDTQKHVIARLSPMGESADSVEEGKLPDVTKAPESQIGVLLEEDEAKAAAEYTPYPKPESDVIAPVEIEEDFTRYMGAANLGITNIPRS